MDVNLLSTCLYNCPNFSEGKSDSKSLSLGENLRIAGDAAIAALNY